MNKFQNISMSDNLDGTSTREGSLLDEIDQLKLRIRGLEKSFYKLRSWKHALEAEGVDNWEGYDLAMDRYGEEVGDE